MKKERKEFNTSAVRLPVMVFKGPDEVKVGPGHYLIWSNAMVTIVVAGQMSMPVSALRIALLSESVISVECRDLVEWAIKEVRPFDPVDSVPHEALLVDPKPPTMEELIRQMIRQEAHNAAPRDEESFDEADDFDVPDPDDNPLSPYELQEGSPEEGELFDDVDPHEKPAAVPAAAVADPKAPAPQGAPTGVPPAAGDAKPQAA